MTRAIQRARLERDRLLLLERRIAVQAQSRAVADGIAETVGLSEARGAEFEHAPSVRGQRETPYRRQPGLDFLAAKGRLTPAQKSAGERYGALYRRARCEGSIPSTLDIKPRASAPGGASLATVLNRAEGTAQAASRLAACRRRLGDQPTLVSACDLVCGQELTPREASANDREAGKLEAVLLVALDLLAGLDAAP